MYITIGQYYPSRSFVHSLDPRGKVIFLFLYVIGLFLCRSPLNWCLAVLILAFALKLSRVPFKLLLKGLRGVMFLIIFTVLINIFFTKDGTVLLKAGFITITDEGLITALRTFLRLCILIIMSSVLTLTTTYLALAEAIESFLKPFKRVGLPAHEIAMMITIALRFIPTIFDELEKIKLAQMSRGATFDEGSFLDKAKAMIPLLIPLFVSAFRTADNLAVAMEARCYRGDIGRTRYRRLIFERKDYFVMCLGAAFALIIAFLRFFGM
ncbi:MAG: energy-coupling factor transporter transmembrane protein EcfT [Eubacterium sp.]|nr:energy-coupling factor transporter transmembrane protein EcfT [Eubacterium sp.]